MMNQSSYPQKLLLFDIDGTLLQPRGMGLKAMLSTLEIVFNQPFERKEVTFAGRTDQQIIHELLQENGINPLLVNSHKKQIFTVFPDQLRIAAQSHSPILLPGVQEILDFLFNQRYYAVGLVTGNISKGAQVKLELVGLNPARFTFGAYGDDAFERNDLPPIAIDRARKHFQLPFTAKDAIVIGDTPGDITCAHTNGIKVLALSTGGFSETDLSPYSPDYFLPDLSDQSAFLRILENNL